MQIFDEDYSSDMEEDEKEEFKKKYVTYKQDVDRKQRENMLSSSSDYLFSWTQEKSSEQKE